MNRRLSKRDLMSSRRKDYKKKQKLRNSVLRKRLRPKELQRRRQQNKKGFD